MVGISTLATAMLSPYASAPCTTFEGHMGASGSFASFASPSCRSVNGVVSRAPPSPQLLFEPAQSSCLLAAGGIAGTVTDASGAIDPAAAMVPRLRRTNLTLISSSARRHGSTGLVTGRYTLIVEAPASTRPSRIRCTIEIVGQATIDGSLNCQQRHRRSTHGATGRLEYTPA